MILTLIRHSFHADWTLGSLYISGRFECFTLEDPDRLALGRPKIPGNTAIPVGTYPVAITMSPRFRRELPIVEDVPGFIGIRIHAGNTAADSEGCILVGTELRPGMVVHSRVAFANVMKHLRAYEKVPGERIGSIRILSAMQDDTRALLEGSWAV